jgi:hypothetical protein
MHISDSVEEMNISNSNFVYIDHLPNSLLTLNCEWIKFLSKLPVHPILKYLFASTCILDSLGDIPPSLRTLDLRNNNIGYTIMGR